MVMDHCRLYKDKTHISELFVCILKAPSWIAVVSLFQLWIKLQMKLTSFSFLPLCDQLTG